jgi:hypothetical protein
MTAVVHVGLADPNADIDAAIMCHLSPEDLFVTDQAAIEQKVTDYFDRLLMDLDFREQIERYRRLLRAAITNGQRPTATLLQSLLRQARRH